MLKLNKNNTYQYAIWVCILIISIICLKLTNLFSEFISVYKLFVQESGILFRHTIVTLYSALLGFIFGFLSAIISTILAIKWRNIRNIISFSATVLYSLPLIASAPIVALIFGAENSGILLGFIGSYLPIFLSGLKSSDQTSIKLTEIIGGFGGSSIDEIKFVKLPFALRGWLIGAQSGWIWAILGAMIGEFTGGRWGLGTFLIGTITSGNIKFLWIIILLSLILSYIGLICIKLFIKIFKVNAAHDSLDISLSEDYTNLYVFNIINFLYFLFFWQIGSWFLNFGGGIFSSPIDIISIAVEIYNGKNNFTSEEIIFALGSTWIQSLIGIMLSIIIAFILALGHFSFSHLFKFFIIPILITQITPIVAFVPLIALTIGRNTYSVILIVILSTIYPAYIIFLRSFEQTSQRALDIIRSFGGDKIDEFKKIRFPQASWLIIVACRLTLARAFLGAITAEYLITGQGIGGILGQARGFLDFRIIWLICTLVVIATILTDYLFYSIMKKRLFVV